MKPVLVGAMLCRNEAAPDRYLRLAVSNALTYCDSIVCVDDGSTDDTVQVLQSMGCEVLTPPGGSQSVSGPFWGLDEVTPRARLWDAATARAAGGWIYVFDADHELVGIDRETLHRCLRSPYVSAWSLPLWDCWDSPDTLRSDDYWQAHRHPRPWFFRALDFVPDWSLIGRKGVHTGHCPPNFPLVAGVLPGAAIRHWGYVRADHRNAKHVRYMALAPSA